MTNHIFPGGCENTLCVDCYGRGVCEYEHVAQLLLSLEEKRGREAPLAVKVVASDEEVTNDTK